MFRLNPSHRTRHRSARSGRRSAHLELEVLEDRTLLAIATTGIPDWIEQGPMDIKNNLSQIPAQENPSVGAIKAVAQHPTDRNIIYVATVNGGVWRTTNGLSSNPVWTALTDHFPSLAMGDIAFSPLDPTGRTLFAAHAHTSSLNSDTSPLLGLLKTTDGGASWVQVGTASLKGKEISSVVPTALSEPTGQVILVATLTDGVHRSVDGGNTFQPISGALDPVTGTLRLQAGAATELIADPADPNRYYVALSAHPAGGATAPADRGVYRSTDGGLTWDPMDTGITDTDLSTSLRIRLAVHYDADAGSHAVYAAVVGPAGTLTGVFRSGNAGESWSFIGAPAIHPGGQGTKDLSLAADARDANVVYIGGDRGAACPGTECAGNLYRGQAVTGGVWLWGPIVREGANGTAPHADSRDMMYVRGATPEQDYILEVDDGGIYKLTNPGSSSREWVSLNANLRTTEMTWGSLDTLNNVFSGATWDNGDIEQRIAPGSSTLRWEATATGDGGQNWVDNSSPTRTYRYRLGNDNIAMRLQYLRRREAVSGLPPSDEVMPMLSGLAGGDSDGNGTDDDLEAAARIALNAINPAWMLIHAQSGVYVSTDRGDSVSVVVAASAIGADASFGGLSAMAFGGRFGALSLPNVAYVGFGNSIYEFNVGSPSSFRKLTSYPGGTPLDLVVDHEDFSTVFALTANADSSARIWMGRNVGLGGSETWVDITKNLNGFLVARRSGRWSAFHKLEVARIDGRLVLLAAGQGGVYRLINPADSSTRWSEFGRGLANAEVFDLDYYPPTTIPGRQGDILVASTMGRGIWTIPNASTHLATPSVLVITGDTDFPGQDDFIRLERDATDPLRIRAFVNNLTFTPDYSVEWTAVDRILVDGLLGNDSVVVDFREGNPVPVSGITVFGGGGLEEDQLIVLGTGLADDITINRSNVVLGTATINYDDLKEVIVDGRGGHDAFNVEPSSLAAQLSVRGGPGDDVLAFDAGPFGGSPTEVFSAEFMGGEGNDRIEATVTGGVDLVLTNDLLVRVDDDPPFVLGSRVVLGGVEEALLIGGPGNNLLDASGFTAGRVTLRGEGGDDHLIGGPNDDTLDGGPGNDTMDGGGGDDTYLEAPGSLDRLIDSAGFDTLDFSAAASGIALDLTRTSGEVQTVDLAGNQIALTGFFERVIGSAFDDRFFWGHTVAGQSILEMLAGAGDDQVIIDGTKATPGTAVSLVGQQGDDRFQIHLPLPGAGGNQPPNPPGDAGLLFVATVDGERLHIVGTDRDDDIRVVGRQDQAQNAHLDVGISDPVSQRLLAQITADNVVHFTLDALAGYDRITALLESAGLIAVPLVANLHGGADDDQLFVDTLNSVGSFAWSVLADGGAGDDIVQARGLTGAILLGGEGNDEVGGGDGRDLLVGGPGADIFTGGKGEDILIPGLTAFDANPDALQAIQGFWTSSQLGFVARVRHLSGLDEGQQSHGPFHLVFAETVFDDGADNTFTDVALDDWLLLPCFVTNTNDSGPGSLREAINCANAAALPGQAAISFRIPPTDPNFVDVDSFLIGTEPGADADADAFVIAPTSELPPLDNIFGWGIILDGRTQTSFGGDTNPFGPEIVLANLGGITYPSVPTGLRLFSEDNRVFGLNLQQFADFGIQIVGLRNWVAGNYIGTDATGRLARGNDTGVYIAGGLGLTGDNRIGTNGDGTNDEAERNVISGNSRHGAWLLGANDVVAGNYIGTDATGLAILGNGGDGVNSGSLFGGNRIGTDGNGLADDVERNVISGNSGHGVSLDALNVVAGNYIGTDATGLVALRNAGDGVHIEFGFGNRIGTNGDGLADDAERNVVSGNGEDGVTIHSGFDNVVAGNFIGVDATGRMTLGNGRYGVNVFSFGRSNRIGTDGSADAFNGNERNVIAGNGLDGVNMDGAVAGAVYENRVSGNFIGTDATGTVALGNGRHGVMVTDGAQSNIIGTNGDGVADASERNVISGNALNGVHIVGIGTEGNIVAGNFIGTDSTGGSLFAGLVSWWKGEDNATDSTDGNHGTLVGETTFHAGKVGQAFRFDGAGDWVQIPDDPALTPSSLTLEAWVNPDALSLVGSAQVILSKYDSSTPAQGTSWVLEEFDGGRVQLVVYQTADRSIYRGVETGPILTAGTWQHVAGTFDLATQELTIYVNGTAIASSLIAGSVPTLTGIADTGSPARIGALVGEPGSPTSFWQGRLDEVAMYNRALTPAEIEAIFNAGSAGRQSNLGNGVDGVRIIEFAADNLIGGTAPAARNIISANGNEGIRIQNGATRNRVEGNYIGTDVAGAIRRGNASDGVAIVEAHANVIGGTVAGAGNLISGNTLNGVALQGSAATDNEVAGNLIGTDVSGLKPLGNFGHGVVINVASNNTIGGPVAGARNIISANGAGVFIGSFVLAGESIGNQVLGNFIGTDVSGRAALGNGRNGVDIVNRARDNVIGTNGDGVADEQEGNVISANREGGVVIRGTDASGNIVAGNWIGRVEPGADVLLGNCFGINILEGANGNTIGGLAAVARNVISGNVGCGIIPDVGRGRGIQINDRGTDNNQVLGNYIGVDVTGTMAVGNRDSGVTIAGGPAFNQVKGNVLSGNANAGLDLYLSGPNNTVAGNYVGLDAAGTAAIPNIYGVTVQFNSDDNTIGTNGDGVDDGSEGNVISGNHAVGVLIAGGSHNVVAGNTIGLDAVRANPVPNNGPGVWIIPSAFGGVEVVAEGNRIGVVTRQVEGNVISANRGDGVRISATHPELGLLIGARENIVAGNTIRDNEGNGVHVLDGAVGNRIGTDGTSVPNDSIEGNLIAGNTLDGVRVIGDTTVRNSIRGNSIHSNNLLGIDLGGDGVTVNDNDDLDIDAGPNQLQNYPNLGAARVEPGGLSVRGTLHSMPNTSYIIDYYANPAADPSGYGEGQRWLGAIMITTNSDGVGRIDHLVAAAAIPGEFVTATATDPDANTSEFSAARPIGGRRGGPAAAVAAFPPRDMAVLLAWPSPSLAVNPSHASRTNAAETWLHGMTRDLDTQQARQAIFALMASPDSRVDSELVDARLSQDEFHQLSVELAACQRPAPPVEDFLWQNDDPLVMLVPEN